MPAPSSVTTDLLPPKLWQSRATDFARLCQKRLLHNGDIMNWLRERGLVSDTVRAARLGWNDRGLYIEREFWGLPPESSKISKVRKLYIPAGLVIPFCPGNTGTVTRLRIRLRTPLGNQSYSVVSGSSLAPTVIWSYSQPSVIIVESELDGLLVDQEAGDLVGVVVLGSVAGCPDPVLQKRLMAVRSILISLNNDAAGNATSEYWLEKYPRARRWTPRPGKNPSEMFLAGQNIRDWIEGGLIS